MNGHVVQTLSILVVQFNYRESERGHRNMAEMEGEWAGSHHTFTMVNASYSMIGVNGKGDVCGGTGVKGQHIGWNKVYPCRTVNHEHLQGWLEG